MGFPWEPEVMCPSPGRIQRHTGRTQYLKLVAAELDRTLPSSHEPEQRGDQEIQPRAAIKADHLRHNELLVGAPQMEGKLICAVRAATISDLVE
ncbi:hypothetical protein AOLI_G00063150 [Acnodon oligacanthus]